MAVPPSASPAHAVPHRVQVGHVACSHRQQPQAVCTTARQQDQQQRAGTLLCACLYTQNIAQKAGLFSVARLKMDLPFHDRLASTGEVPTLLQQLQRLVARQQEQQRCLSLCFRCHSAKD